MRGMRSITVGNVQFRWRFDERLVVIPKSQSSLPLDVDWGWQDWLEPEGPGPAPQIVTPQFVAQAIDFALANGWQPQLHGPPIRLAFHENQFEFIP